MKMVEVLIFLQLWNKNVYNTYNKLDLQNETNNKISDIFHFICNSMNNKPLQQVIRVEIVRIWNKVWRNQMA